MAVVLAGDIGGTKTVLALYEGAGAALRPRREAVFASAAHAGLEDILSRFLAGEAAAIDAACFGVAGPVIDGRAEVTNLPWRLDEAELARACRTPRAVLLNDLAATALGLLGLPDRERVVLHAGSRPGQRGNVAVLAAGTGLGEALLYWDGERHHALASEGGHADFAPASEEEVELWRFLRAEHGGHVSLERVLSGPGLYNLYRFARRAAGEPEPDWLAERLRREDPAAAIGAVGLAGGDPVCAHALELFASIYGSEAGNLALRGFALGGVVVAGGIAPKILPTLQRGGFMRAFLDKGRLSELLAGIPVSVASNPRAPLLGAAQLAAGLAR